MRNNETNGTRPMIFDLICQHVPRTGGVSLYLMLKREARSRRSLGLGLFAGLDRFYEVNPEVRPAIACIGHRHLPSMIRDGLISAESIKGASAFMFVRNPWDRLVSLYGYLRNMPNRCHDISREDMATFEKFAALVCKTRMSLDTSHCEVNAFRWNGNEHGLRQCQSQCEWLDSLYEVDFHQVVTSGRYEELASEIARVLGTFCVVCNQKLPYRNYTKRLPYPGYYTPELRDAVGERYADDIERFGYTFDGERTDE